MLVPHSIIINGEAIRFNRLSDEQLVTFLQMQAFDELMKGGKSFGTIISEVVQTALLCERARRV